jgi:hypothetical protein
LGFWVEGSMDGELFGLISFLVVCWVISIYVVFNFDSLLDFVVFLIGNCEKCCGIWLETLNFKTFTSENKLIRND